MASEAAERGKEVVISASLDLLEAAWGVIANAGGGNWKRETPEWQEAAARWRDRYHALIGEGRAAQEAKR